ncbi:cytochrome P450 [Aspergillus heterothallicus]
MAEGSTAAVAGTPATLRTIVAMAAAHPMDTETMRVELDRVVGCGRLPTLDDRESLPYMQAFTQECLRVQPAAPVAGPHAVVRDDEYRGYRIPRGAIILPFQEAMNLDDGVFEDPLTFSP